MNIEDIAKIAHEINRAYCCALGDFSQPEWNKAPPWQKESAINGVKFHLENPTAPPSVGHDAWLAEKRLNGWKYGKKKDEEKKEHPCFLAYDDLPVSQKVKDYLFKATVKQARNF